ncbi:MAG: sugar phosphorylase, partial [Proteobacteria bacterium]
ATKQVDLNFANPKVFVEAAKILNFYAEKGAGLIRLDAIGYLWKRLGSSSIHEPEAHALVSAMAEVLALAYPQVITVSEVNEPQDRSFTYLGSSERPEADLVYQFSHFPLAIHAIHTGNAEFYQSWLASMNEVGGRQFVTVLGSHDGMGLKPVRGILPDGELEKLSTLLVEQCGCKPNYAVLPGGSKIIYEICATPWNLVNTSNSRLDFETQLARYSVVLILGLSVRGLPAIYFNGIFGAENYAPSGGLDENRTVNRENTSS